MLFFYDACISIWQPLHVCGICNLKWCNDYCVMVWFGQFCSFIQNYLNNWHSFFCIKSSKPNNHSKYFAIFSHFLFITSWFRFSESQILHKSICKKWTSKWNNKILKRWSKPWSRMILYSLWNRVLRSFWCLWVTLWVNSLPFTACSHMKNNLHFWICDKQQSPQDSLALMVARAHRYLSRTQSYIFHKYDLSNAWK